MIYDCFSFFNEYTILDIRLNTLYDKVDKFILVEATKSHQNIEKPLYFLENKSRYEKFIDKIIHVVVDDYPEHSYWSFEENQRDFIVKKAFELADNDDIIFISDVDEIWDPSRINLENIDSEKLYKWPSYVCFHYFNLLAQEQLWYQPMYCKLSALKKYCLDQGLKFSHDVFRNKSGNIDKNDYVMIDDISGWHFSYTEDIEYKLKNFLHSEYRNMSNEYFLTEIKKGKNPFTGEPVFLIENIDDYLPQYVKDNVDMFRNKILS